MASVYPIAEGKSTQLFAHPPRPIIIHENRDWVVFFKPPGLETVSRDGGPELVSLVREALGEPNLTPAHRLDRDTSGAQLFARNPEAEMALTRLFRERRMEKTYLAICFGVPRNREGSIRRKLSEWESGRRPVRVVRRGGREASTRYRLLAASDELPAGWRASLVAFSPHQGRTHQIRVHAAAFGYPIMADDQYGNRSINRQAGDWLGLKRQALHSWRLSFDWRGEKVEAVCPLPDDLRLAMGKLGLAGQERQFIHW
ncbi:MAG: RluA family pseudouridine synthase [Planctomycetes bacterium]|nr:RluA family pseudouridine synthase [Planctomycetota bacterium]